MRAAESADAEASVVTPRSPATAAHARCAPSDRGHEPAPRVLGRWSAWACVVLSLVYIIAQLAEWRGWLGSAGGPHSRSTPFGLALLLTPSLLLAPAFSVMMVCVHHGATPARRVWSHAAVVFATVYATFVCLVYFVQLTFVMPRMARGDTQTIGLLLFEPFDSFLYAVDILGYSMMCLAMLFASAVFQPTGRERWIRGALMANGALTPFLALQMYFPWLIYGASLWSLFFPAACALLAMHWRRDAACPPLSQA